MTHTFTKLLYHLVWATKERQNLIRPEFQERIYGYIGGSLRGMGGTALEIGGMGDHIHVLAMIPPKIALADVMRDMKSGSSKWINETFPKMHPFGWQEGYGAFAVSESNRGMVADYIQKQPEHHKSYDFREEFIVLVRKHGLEIEERYLWK